MCNLHNKLGTLGYNGGLEQNLKPWYNQEKGGETMRDFPLFPTEYGVASLILKEIPYRETAYITIQEARKEDVTELLKECKAFCRMAGAEKIYVKGHPDLQDLPLHCRVLQMRGTAWVDPEKLESLFPVTDATAARWRSVYNEKMRQIDNAATLTSRDEKQLLEASAYFVHHEGELLGIGWLEDTKLQAIASAIPGAGERVMHTLMSLVEGAQMTLEVASTNSRAIRFYEKLGFLVTGEVSQWYQL